MLVKLFLLVLFFVALGMAPWLLYVRLRSVYASGWRGMLERILQGEKSVLGESVLLEWSFAPPSWSRRLVWVGLGAGAAGWFVWQGWLQGGQPPRPTMQLLFYGWVAGGLVMAHHLRRRSYRMTTQGIEEGRPGVQGRMAWLWRNSMAWLAIEKIEERKHSVVVYRYQYGEQRPRATWGVERWISRLLLRFPDEKTRQQAVRLLHQHRGTTSRSGGS